MNTLLEKRREMELVKIKRNSGDIINRDGRVRVALILLFFFVIVPLHSNATDFYVRLDGNNFNTGTENTPEGAWLSLPNSLAKLGPGDRLLVEDGVYEVNRLITTGLNGTASAPITIKAINSWGAKIAYSGTPEWSNLWEITKSSYLIIEGFELYGVPENKGAGISISDNSHHVTVRNNYTHDFGCNGIGVGESDYITIEGNVARDNAKVSEYNCSGITVIAGIPYDEREGFHYTIRGNVTFENECRLPFRPGGFDTPTDGNGIIVDFFREHDYDQDILVENNLSFNNGGRGIHVFNSDNVTVRNNTVWHNLYVLQEYTEFTADMEVFWSDGSSVYNNLIIKNNLFATRGLRLFEFDGQNTEVFNNLVVGEKDFFPQTPSNGDNIFQNENNQDFPLLNEPSENVSFSSVRDFKRYFGLQLGSPAIGEALVDRASALDIDGVDRTEDGKADIGCYEYSLDPVTSTKNNVNADIKIAQDKLRESILVSGTGFFDVGIYSLAGSLLVSTTSLTEIRNQTIDVSGVGPGIYIVRVSGDQLLSSKKIKLN